METDFVLLPDKDKLVRVAHDEITYICSDKMRCDVHTTKPDKIYIVATNLGSLEKKLPCPDRFCRVNNRHIVHLAKIKEYHPKTCIIVMCDGAKVPVSRGRKEIFKFVFVYRYVTHTHTHTQEITEIQQKMTEFQRDDTKFQVVSPEFQMAIDRKPAAQYF